MAESFREPSLVLFSRLVTSLHESSPNWGHNPEAAPCRAGGAGAGRLCSRPLGPWPLEAACAFCQAWTLLLKGKGVQEPCRKLQGCGRKVAHLLHSPESRAWLASARCFIPTSTCRQQAGCGTAGLLSSSGSGISSGSLFLCLTSFFQLKQSTLIVWHIRLLIWKINFCEATFKGPAFLWAVTAGKLSSLQPAVAGFTANWGHYETKRYSLTMKDSSIRISQSYCQGKQFKITWWEHKNALHGLKPQQL